MGRAKGHGLKLFHKQVGSEGADRGTHGNTMDLFIILWKRKCMFLKLNSSSVMICWMDMLVLWGNVGSWSNFCFTHLMERSTGMEVNRALTSYDVITSPSSSFTFCMCYTKCWVCLRWCGD